MCKLCQAIVSRFVFGNFVDTFFYKLRTVGVLTELPICVGKIFLLPKP